MQNVVQRIEGNKLIIEIDLSQEQGLSESGKVVNIANTGFRKIEGYGLKLNVWKSVKK